MAFYEVSARWDVGDRYQFTLSQGLVTTAETADLNSKLPSSLAIVVDRVQMETKLGWYVWSCAASMVVLSIHVTR